MRKAFMVIALSILVVCLLLSSCIEKWEYRPPSTNEPTTIEQPNVEVAVEEKAVAPYGIRLGKTIIEEFYPGAFVDTLTTSDPTGWYREGDPTGVIIINNLDEARNYNLYCVKPNQLEDGYVAAPQYVMDNWVVISDPTPRLEAGEAKLIPISLWMPMDAAIFAAKWEFRIYIIDVDQVGFARTAYEARWLITMKD